MRKEKNIVLDKSVKYHISRKEIRKKYHISIGLLEKEFGECAITRITLNGISSSISVCYDEEKIKILVKAFKIRYSGNGKDAKSESLDEVYNAKKRRIRQQYIDGEYQKIKKRAD